MIVEKYGWDYMDKYMAQLSFVTTGHAAVSNAIAAGEKLTFDSTSTTPRLKAQGNPIEPDSKADRTPVFLVGAAIFKDARRTPTPPSSISPGIWPRSSRAATARSRRAPTSSARRLGAAFVLQHRQPVPYPGVGRGGADGIAQTTWRLHRAAVRMTPSVIAG